MIYRPFQQGWHCQGWQCPVCKGVYAPSMPVCIRCSGVTPPNVAADTDWRKQSPLLREASNGCYCEACMEADEQ